MKLGEGTVFALSGVFSNGVGIGIPFISYAFGDAGLVPLLMIISMNSLVMLTLASFLIEVGGQTSSRESLLGKLGGAVVKMLKHPVIPSIFAGLFWGELCHLIPGLGTPVVIDRILQALATAAPPCGLIMAGASLAHVGLKAHWQAASVATVLKLAADAAGGLGLRPLAVPPRSAVAHRGDPERRDAGRRQRLPDRPALSHRRRARDQCVVLSTASAWSRLSATLLLLGVQTR